MKLDAIVFGAMGAVTINCKSTLPILRLNHIIINLLPGDYGTQSTIHGTSDDMPDCTSQ